MSFCVRWVSHPKSAVRDVFWRRSLLIIKYFAALYLTNGSSRRMVKIEHYLEGETLAVFEQSLRTLHREAWLKADIKSPEADSLLRR